MNRSPSRALAEWAVRPVTGAAPFGQGARQSASLLANPRQRSLDMPFRGLRAARAFPGSAVNQSRVDALEASASAAGTMRRGEARWPRLVRCSNARRAAAAHAASGTLNQRRQNQSRRQCRSTMPSNGARSRRSRQLVGTAPWNTSPIRIGARQSDWLFRSDVAQVPVAGCLRGAACLLGFDTERRAARAAAARDGVARVTDLRAAATVFAALIDQRRTTSAESPRFHPEPTSQRAGKTTR